MIDTNTEFEFNYASFKLTPYKGVQELDSSKLLKEIILKFRSKDYPNEKKIIDRHKNRKNTIKRELVIVSNRFLDTGKRCFGKIALIKNRTPFIWDGKSDIIEQIEKEKNKQFIEITNYAIHFCENAPPVIMFEYNHEGPRISDFEYYLRQISKEMNLAKQVNYSIHLNADYDELDNSIKNIFSITVKVNSAVTNRFNWLSSLRNINDDTGFKDVRLEFFYNRVKDNVGQYKKNIRGLDFARLILNWLKKDNNNIENIDDLKMAYQTDNSDEIIELDFIKNKVVSILNVNFGEGDLHRTNLLQGEMATEFNYYLNTNKTNNYSVLNTSI